MLFAIFVAVLVIGIACVVIYKKSFDDYRHEWIQCVGVLFIVLAAVAVIVSLFVMGANYIDKDAEIARLETRSEMLTYQYENDIYENDNDLGKRELIVDIQEWNETLAVKQDRQNNIWVGIYIPNIYDQFSFISLGDVGTE